MPVLQRWFRTFLKKLIINAPVVFVMVGFLIVLLAALSLFSQNSQFDIYDRDKITQEAWTSSGDEVIVSNISIETVEIDGLGSGEESQVEDTAELAESETQVPEENQEYITVEAGDSWWSLAELYLGSGYKYRELATYNGFAVSEPLRVGTKVVLPDALETEMAVTEQNTITEDQSVGDYDVATRTYQVQKNDSLWSIAERELGDPYLWVQIYQLNSDHIADPDFLYTGMLLKLPESAKE